MSQQQVVAQLAPHGVLRAAINMGNFLLVTGRTASGDPDGCSPDMARAIAESPGVPIQFVPLREAWRTGRRRGKRTSGISA